MRHEKPEPKALGIGERIARLIEERGISRTILAEKAQLSSSAVSSLIGGHRQPGIEVVSRLAEALGTSCDFLIAGKSAVTPQQAEPKPPEMSPGAQALLSRWKAQADQKPSRFRRRAQDVAPFRERMATKRKRLEAWELEMRDEVLICWKALASEPVKRQAASSLLSFFVRYKLPLRRWGLRRFIPGECEPRSLMAYTENPADDQIPGYLKSISPVKLRILHDYLRDLLGLPTRVVKEPKTIPPSEPGLPGEAVPPPDSAR